MCGIAGAVDCSGARSDTQLTALASAMAARLAHRGPDSRGTWVDAAAGVAIGHSRLSIIDLSPTGHQPMISADGRWVLTYNGELYNTRELREELLASGAQLRGTSDTEVLLEAIARWGVPAAARRANAMFAFAAWDRRDRVLWLARDRLGEKPLYYGYQGRSFVFASELKALRAHPEFEGRVSREALNQFLRMNAVPAPLSIYSGIAKLPPGCVLAVRPETTHDRPTPFWSASDEIAAALSAPVDPPDSANLELLLRDSVRRRMIADVPLGALLSGGIDSSTVVALMQLESARPVRTFSIGFHEAGFDEAAHARRVAQHLGTDHTELYVTSAEAQTVIPRLSSLYDEPFADSSQIPTVIVSELARRSVTVALSGDGGDELFGGYNRHLWWEQAWRAIHRVPRPLRTTTGAALRRVGPRPWSALGRAVQRLGPDRRMADGRLGERVVKVAALLETQSASLAYERLTSLWDEDSGIVIGVPAARRPREWPMGSPTFPTFTEEMMYRDTVEYLPNDILTKVDRASMSVGLEVRIPLLDHRVVEAAWRIPLRQKVAGGRGKLALREVLYRHVPQELVERPKTGFAVPIGAWLRGPLRTWAGDLLHESTLRNDGYLNVPLVRRALDEHSRGRGQWQDHLWGVLMFQAWLEEEKTRSATSAPAP